MNIALFQNHRLDNDFPTLLPAAGTSCWMCVVHHSTKFSTEMLGLQPARWQRKLYNSGNVDADHMVVSKGTVQCMVGARALPTPSMLAEVGGCLFLAAFRLVPIPDAKACQQGGLRPTARAHCLGWRQHLEEAGPSLSLPPWVQQPFIPF